MSRREGPVLYTVDGVEVRLGTEDWDERLARLEGVLTQIATQASVRAVDLRFRDQVVLQRGRAADEAREGAGPDRRPRRRHHEDLRVIAEPGPRAAST